MSSPSPPSGPVRVGIVDDAPEVRRFMELYLGRREGIEVIGVAADGPAGLELVARARPDVLVLDLAMPGMDGYEVLEALAEQGSTRTRVVVVSGLGVAEVNARCLELGAWRVLDKAEGFEELPEVVLEVAAARR